jgi:hypothetical protein
MAYRLQNGRQMLADFVLDPRHSARSSARTPGYTVVAVAVPALGIGANSAIFSLVSAVWLRPLPFADAERLVSILVDLRLRRPDGDPAAVGRTITLDGSPHTIVGVVPRDFRFPQGESDVFIPTVFAPELRAARVDPAVTLRADN